MKLRPILGLSVLFGGLVFLLVGSVPGVLSDLLHRSQFRPAAAAVVTGADCTTWNYAMLHRCTFKIRDAANGPEQEIQEWAFGAAPEGRVQVLETGAEPRAYTTDVALNELTGRIVFVVALIGGTILFLVGLGLKIVRARRPASA